MKPTTTKLSLAVVLVLVAACGTDAAITDTSTPSPDSGSQDSGRLLDASPPGAGDAGRDGTIGGGNEDANGVDANGVDANAADANIAIDGGVGDATAPSEAGVTDAGGADAHDASLTDAAADAGDTGGGGGGNDSGNDSGATSPFDVRLDEVQVAGTHNSYHVAPLVAFDASHKYTQKPLDQQLAGGVRQLELDLHLGATGTFEVYHLPVIDANATCHTLEECLNVIDVWSRAHPTHTPIFVWFEIKDAEGGSPIDTLQPVDDKLVSIFGQDRLITPAWLQKSYASPRARLTAEGWPRLHEVHGKIMPILLNDNDSHAQNYTNGYTSLDGRKMFASANSGRIDAPWAVVTKMDPSDSNGASAARANHLLTCANVCSVDKSDADCATLLASALGIGLNMLSDDLPFPVAGRSYHLALPHGSPGCDSVTATPGCDPAHLE